MAVKLGLSLSPIAQALLLRLRRPARADATTVTADATSITADGK